jgi:TetR/AcrR family transcriptional regulator
MTTTTVKPRRLQILEAFASMLEASPGVRITTAALAKEVGVSEAALYRHFPSKTKMFEGLIDAIDDAVLTPAAQLAARDEVLGLTRCEEILALLLQFAERNPGMTRILTGDALAGETDRLHQRVVQFFDRLESLLKQVLRESELAEGLEFTLPVSATAHLWLAAAEGRIAQFVRSQFKASPLSHWKEHWPVLSRGFVVQPEVELA